MSTAELTNVAPVNLAEKLALLSDCGAPRVVGSYNDNDLMLLRIEGALEWQSHSDTDGFFMAVTGKLDIELREGRVPLEPGELYVVPAGVEHRLVARPSASILLIEPAGTPNTGDYATAVTKARV